MDPNVLLTRETNIRRDAQLRWWAGDVLVEHPGVVRAFHTWVRRAPDGRLCLANSLHWVYVAIEGAPFMVDHARIVEDALECTLRGGLVEVVELVTLRLDSCGRLHADVVDGTLAACFSHQAFSEIGDALDTAGEAFVLTVGIHRVLLPTVEDPLRPARLAVLQRAP